MRPLIERKVTRENKNEVEWEPAEHHLTHDGTAAFMARMKQRIAAADKARTAASNVKPFKEKTK